MSDLVTMEDPCPDSPTGEHVVQDRPALTPDSRHTSPFAWATWGDNPHDRCEECGANVLL